MRTPRTVPAGDTGSAVVEFVTVGVLLLVPILYLVVTLGRIQAAAFATEAAARGAARALTVADDEAAGQAAAAAVVTYALSDQGFEVDPDRATAVECPVTGCLTPGGSVVVRVEVAVTLPGVPGFLAGALPVAVPVSATQVATVDQFRGVP